MSIRSYDKRQNVIKKCINITYPSKHFQQNSMPWMSDHFVRALTNIDAMLLVHVRTYNGSESTYK